MSLKRALLLAAVTLLASLPLTAGTRLTYVSNGTPIPVYWPSFPVSYQIDSRVARSIPGGVDTVERAFATWASVPDTKISFRDIGVADGLKAGYDGKNTITLADDLFKGQNAIALTTYWDDSSGKRTEADIQIDSTMLNAGYNIPLALTHEVGHLLGLDHSAVLSAVMYPYLSRDKDAPALDSDDRTAIAGMYPELDPTMAGAVLKGRVVGDSGGLFAAQVVAVNDRGEPVATALTNSTGDFTLQAIPPGSYRLYAEPLDGPVDTRNLSGSWQQSPAAVFATEFLAGGPISVENGKVYGNLIVNTSGPPPQLNPRWIGVAAAGVDEFDLSSTAETVHPGQTVSIAVAGDGITGGMTTFQVLNPGVRRTSEFRYAGNYVYATFSVSPDAPPGSAVVLMNSGNSEATLTGGLRIEGPPARMRIARR